MAQSRRVAAGVTAACFALCVPVRAVDRTVSTTFCVQQNNGDWSVEPSKPLINLKARTVFAELSVAGGAFTEFRLRRFDELAEVIFDYHFTPNGVLNALLGSVVVIGDWRAEANIMPEADGTSAPYRMEYRRGESRIPPPENAKDYVGRLDHPPVYRTAASVPCAAMIQGV